MMKYSLRPREIQGAKSEGFPEGSGYISLYFPTRVTIQTFSITTQALEINIGQLILCIAPTAGQCGKYSWIFHKLT